MPTRWLGSSATREFILRSSPSTPTAWPVRVPVALSCRAAYATTVEDSVYVAGDRRGEGVGRLLLEELVILATRQGFHTVIARTSVTTIPRSPCTAPAGSSSSVSNARWDASSAGGSTWPFSSGCCDSDTGPVLRDQTPRYSSSGAPSPNWRTRAVAAPASPVDEQPLALDGGERHRQDAQAHEQGHRYLQRVGMHEQSQQL